MDNTISKRVWIFCMVFAVAYGFRSYQTRIPNGNRVPHPCPSSPAEAIWDAVGHMSPHHVRPKNAFGRRIKEIGIGNWQRLCAEDSDGDGLTNGQELGDPDCLWEPNRGTRLSEPRGHPGICEPGRPQCTSGVVYPQCGNAGHHGGGQGASHSHQPTPAPHFGKHPQALLTERLGQTPGGGFGGFGGSFPPTAAPPAGFGSQGFPGSFGGPGPSGQGSFGNQGPPPMTGSIGRPSSGFNGVPNWAGSGPTSGGMEPSRDAFSRTLNQQFLQGGGSGPFGGGMPQFQVPQQPFGGGFQQQPGGGFQQQPGGGFQQQPGGGFQQQPGSFESQVQRRIQQARGNAGVRRPPFNTVDWRGQSGGTQMGPQFMQPFYPETRSFGGGMRGGRF